MKHLLLLGLLLVSFLCASIKTIVQTNLPKIVYIESYAKNNLLSTGSGFVISNDGHIATNFHVIEGADNIKIFILGQSDSHTVNSLFNYDSDKDIAILKVEAKTDKVQFSSTRDFEVGSEVVAIGNPEGLVGSVSNGIIGGIRQHNTINYLQITAPISHGSSGGAVFDSNGKVIGMATSSITEGQNLNFALPYHLITELLSQEPLNKKLTHINFVANKKIDVENEKKYEFVSLDDAHQTYSNADKDYDKEYEILFHLANKGYVQAMEELAVIHRNGYASYVHMPSFEKLNALRKKNIDTNKELHWSELAYKNGSKKILCSLGGLYRKLNRTQEANKIFTESMYRDYRYQCLDEAREMHLDNGEYDKYMEIFDKQSNNSYSMIRLLKHYEIAKLFYENEKMQKYMGEKNHELLIEFLQEELKIYSLLLSPGKMNFHLMYEFFSNEEFQNEIIYTTPKRYREQLKNINKYLFHNIDKNMPTKQKSILITYSFLILNLILNSDFRLDTDNQLTFLWMITKFENNEISKLYIPKHIELFTYETLKNMRFSDMDKFLNFLVEKNNHEILYQNANSTTRENDRDLREYWLKKAAEKGSAKALSDLGHLYKNKLGPDENHKANHMMAIKYFISAYDNGVDSALGDISFIYLIYGRHYKDNEMMELLRNNTKLKNEDLIKEIFAYHYWHNKQYDESIKIIKELKEPDVHLSYNMGVYYSVHRQYNLANQYLNSAMVHGNNYAKCFLAENYLAMNQKDLAKRLIQSFYEDYEARKKAYSPLENIPICQEVNQLLN